MSKSNFFKREEKKEHAMMKERARIDEERACRKPTKFRRIFETAKRAVRVRKRFFEKGLSRGIDYSQETSNCCVNRDGVCSQDERISIGEIKSDEYLKNNVGLQFFYILAQLGIFNLISKRESTNLLYASTKRSIYNVHHIRPLALFGENGFNNLCLIDKSLHRFVHKYCLSPVTLDFLGTLPTKKREELLKQFTPQFTPLAKIEDFFNKTIVCAVKSTVYTTPIEDLNNNKTPISSKDVKEAFPEGVFRYITERGMFDAELFDRYVELNVSHRLVSRGKKKEDIKKEMNVVEKQLLEPAKVCEFSLARIRELYNLNKLLPDTLQHYVACSLIRHYGLAPKRVMTWEQMEKISIRLLDHEKQKSAC